MIWTDDSKAQVAAMLSDGLTGSQISAKFPGVSRSAVIALVNRDPDLKAIGFRRKPGQYGDVVIPDWVPEEIRKGYRLVALRRGEEEAAAMARYYKRLLVAS